MTNKQRLDLLLVKRGFADSRNKAAAMIMAAEIRVDGRLVDKPGTFVNGDVCIQLKEKQRYVSRAGHKLEAALREFRIDAAGKICADVGASTGGFTDCLLQAGAARVHAIDVGSGIIDYKLRHDKRVRLLERTNARYLDSLGERVGLLVVDVSFISLRHILPKAKGWLLPQADIVALVKPQFEAGKSEVGKGGVIKDPTVHKRVLHEVAVYAASHSLSVLDLMRSPITGKKGNAEFLLRLRNGSSSRSESEVLTCIRRLIDSTFS